MKKGSDGSCLIAADFESARGYFYIVPRNSFGQSFPKRLQLLFLVLLDCIQSNQSRNQNRKVENPDYAFYD